MTAESPNLHQRLGAVAAVSRNDAWAAGRTGNADPVLGGGDYHAFVEHWDGKSWSVVPAPGGTADATMTDLEAVSADDVWGVGSQESDVPLIEHWDGSTWKTVPGADVQGHLGGLDATSSSDVWAVGGRTDDVPLIEHWDGVAWSEVPGPSLFGVSGLSAVWAFSPDYAWAGGGIYEANGLVPLLLRWNGHAWRRVAAPHPDVHFPNVVGISGTSRRDVWAVAVDGVILHWDGSSWTSIPPPMIGPTPPQFSDVVAVNPANVWAVGSLRFGDTKPVVIHWDGTGWRIVSWGLGGGERGLGTLYAVDARGARDVWAVGASGDISAPQQARTQRLCPIGVQDSGFVPSAPTVRVGRTVTWVFGRANDAERSVADATGLSLFDSGPRAPGASFDHRFWAAGTYPVVDATTVETGVVQVRLTASPDTSRSCDGYRVVWALRTPGADRAFDVQIRRPNDDRFRDWHMATTRKAAFLCPGNGTGTFRLRARLRDLAGHRTGWSPEYALRI